MAEFLFEIGLEEVPARMIAGAQAELERRVVAMLERERLVAAGCCDEEFFYASAAWRSGWVRLLLGRRMWPRRCWGPRRRSLIKDGVATPAAVAFAKKAGVAVDELKTVTNAEGGVPGGDVGEGWARGRRGDCRGDAEGVGGDLLGEEYVLASRASRSGL